MSKKLIRCFLLQLKFILVAWLNATYSIFPFGLRKLYLRLYGIRLGRKSTIHRKCRFFHIGKVLIGENVVINSGCYLDNRRGIYIGNNVGIAHDTKIYTLGHDINSPYFITKGAEVIIKDNVFIFSNVIIMPGCTIHEGAIVLPGSVVIKDVPAFSVVGGNPAKYIKERSRCIEYKLYYPYLFAQ